MIFAVPSQLGYAALAGLILGESAGVPLPGETALITAGGLAAAGHLSLPLVILVAAGAAIAGDTLGYLLGRRGGRALLLRDGRALLLRDGVGAAHRRRTVALADRFFARFGVAAVFLGRWAPGVRIVAGVTAGAALMPWRRFAPANASGALAWAASIATLAMLAGPAGSLALAAAGLGVAAITLALAWRAHRGREPEPQSGSVPAEPAPHGVPSSTASSVAP
jgi:membrane protein DedA with SNARE-associated domain